MKPKALLLSSVLATLVAVPAMAQPRGRTSMIALQVNVEDTGTRQQVTYGLRPNTENIPLAPGQSMRVSLVGTAIVNNVGVERPVRARFFPVSGSSGVELGQSGSNWVVVRGRGAGGNGLAQIGYEVTDNAYQMKGAFDSGRITFQMAGGGDRRGEGPGPGPGVGPGPGYGGDRRAAAEEITRELYRAILRQDDTGSRRAQDDAAAIARGGLPTIVRVATSMAVTAEGNGTYDRRNARETVGELYRQLLHRDMSNREIAYQDPGFRDNVRLLQDRGLAALVQTIVGSQEYQRVHELERHGMLYGDGDRRDRRPR
jgi:hypothetical protein